MATALSYGSITIIDTTDIGEFSAQPMANLPLSVIYDPDQDNFTPNWGTSNLLITPAIYYAGESLTLGTTGLTVTWERQEGTAGRTPLTTGETVVDGGKLSVTANKFTSASTMLTYICTATYVEPTSQQTLTAQGQITFTLVKNASTAETCFITGDSIFKYGADGRISGASTITLTAKVSNVTISEWQYQSATSPITWTKYPGSGTATSLTVNASDSVFIGDKCIIRLTTSDPDVYDYHTITKLRDGAAGSSTVSGVLTNDDQMIPFTRQGGTETGDYSSARSQVIIYEGGTDKTSEWTITQSYDSSITATASTTTTANDTVQVTNLSANTGNVTFTCRKNGYNDIIKTFSLIKVTSGADGVSPTIYSVDSSTLAINKTSGTSPTFSPASVTFSAYQYSGTTKSTYQGMFQIFENITLAEYDAASTKPQPVSYSTAAESVRTYTPSTSATSILCILYEAGGFTKRLDSQLVVVTTDGAKGEQGEQGEDGEAAVNVIFTNYADVLTCTNSDTLSAAQTIKIPFAAYEGTTRIPCTFTAVNLLGVAPQAIGTGANNSKYATATSDGQIVYILPVGTAVGQPSGNLSIQFTATPSSGTPVNVVQTYSWSRNRAAKDGTNSVMLQIFTPSGGNVVSQDVSQVNLQAQLTDGATDVTTQSGITWQWYKYTISGGSGSYQPLSGKTTYTLTVAASDVDSYASYKLEATYASKTYTAYFSVFDKTDPIQVSVMSSVGTQLVNGMGAGGLYVRVTRNGEEIDKMKSERFFTGNPSEAKSGDYYYKIDETNKTLTLMKYTTSWQVAPSSDSQFSGTYTWTWRDKEGVPIQSVNGNTLPTQGKVIYIDGDFVDKKIIADVEVSI